MFQAPNVEINLLLLMKSILLGKRVFNHNITLCVFVHQQCNALDKSLLMKKKKKKKWLRRELHTSLTRQGVDVSYVYTCVCVCVTVQSGACVCYCAESGACLCVCVCVSAARDRHVTSAAAV